MKDAFHDAVIHGRAEAVNPRGYGTKAAPHCVLEIPAGGEVVLRLRLAPAGESPVLPFAEFDEIFAERIAEAAAFFETK